MTQTDNEMRNYRGLITLMIALAMALMAITTGCATDTAPNNEEEGASTNAPGTTAVVTQLPLGSCTTTIECDPGRYAECLSSGAIIACVDNACVASGGSVDLDCVVDHAVGANETACDDGLDNDSDTLSDCRDPDCLAQSCDDSSACTTNDVCGAGGSCGGTVVPDLGPPAATCLTRVCDSATGWRSTPAIDGTSCADDNVCNGAEVCGAGVCLSGTALTCDNGLFCDGTEVCNSTLGCQSGVPPIVADAVTCTVDSCDETTDSIVHTANNAACDNGLFCDGTEVCNSTLGCQSGTAIPCTTAALCATSSCNEALDACVEAPVTDGTVCDDGFSCSTSSLCVAGNCVSTTPNNDVCDDGLTIDPAALDICVAGYTESIGVNATNHIMVDDRGCVRCYSTSDPRCVDIFGDLLSDILPPEGTVVRWCYTTPPTGQTWYGSISYGGLTDSGWSFNPDIPLVGNCANHVVPMGISFVWIDGTSGLQASPSIWWLGPNGNPPTSISVNGVNYPVPTYTPTSASGSGFRVNLVP
jgi:hypothetical protein